MTTIDDDDGDSSGNAGKLFIGTRLAFDDRNSIIFSESNKSPS